MENKVEKSAYDERREIERIKTESLSEYRGMKNTGNKTTISTIAIMVFILLVVAIIHAQYKSNDLRQNGTEGKKITVDVSSQLETDEEVVTSWQNMKE